MQDLENTMPLSEAAVDAEQGGENPDGTKVCLNCGQELTGKYCSQCGQKDIPKRQTLGELIENFIGSFFSFESKFFRTVKYLLLKPGHLAREYNAGRRESFYHPARMYVFISFVYFLLFFSIPENEERNDEVQGAPEGLSYKSDRSGTNFSFDTDEFKTREAYDSAQQTLPVEERDGWFMRKLNYRQIDLQAKYDGKNQQFSRDFGDAFTANFPKVFFLLLPIFALLLKLLYVRRDFYYTEHLVASIYFYNFFFLVGGISMLIAWIPGMSWFTDVTFFLILIYLLVSMKRLYQQAWPKTTLKFFLLFGAFSICMGLGMLLNLVVVLMFI
jgi:hypothetical protein